MNGVGIFKPIQIDIEFLDIVILASWEETFYQGIQESLKISTFFISILYDLIKKAEASLQTDITEAQ